MTNYSYTDGLLDAVTQPDGSVSSYTYDAAGNVLTETDPLGRVTTYA